MGNPFIHDDPPLQILLWCRQILNSLNLWTCVVLEASTVNDGNTSSDQDNSCSQDVGVWSYCQLLLNTESMNHETSKP